LIPIYTSLSAVTQADLGTVATSLNDRSGKTLDSATPNEHFTKLLTDWKVARKPHAVVFAMTIENAKHKPGMA
jgi:hypothetical protein